MVYKVEIEENGIWNDYSAFARLPFSLSERLDTGLDSATIELVLIDREAIFLPYTRVKITIGSKIYRFYVGSSEKTRVNTARVIITTTYRYTHTLHLIEPTKYLEVVFAETNTVTQKLKGNYVGTYKDATITYDNTYFPDAIDEILFNIQDPSFISDNLYIPTYDKIVTLISPSAILGATVTSDLGTIALNSTVNIANLGSFYIEFTISYMDASSIYRQGTIRYSFEVIEIPQQEAKTISGELQKIVDIAETCRNGIDTPRFVIDPDILTKYEDDICPEFSFTRQTLWEKMLQIGDYIHAIPRLISDESENWNIITFDFLGKTDIAVNDGLFSNTTSNMELENYCTEFDSQVDQIVNTDNKTEASIVDPAENIFRTVRTEESGVEVTDDNGFFATEQEIAELIKVEVEYDGDIYDITRYCYEQYEYAVLSDYKAYYPYSKAYALTYSLGSKNITGLQHKNQDILGSAFENWAIVNILKKVGATVPLITTGLVIGLKYRIQYVPIVSTRLKQKKVNQDDYETKATLVYNQQSNSVNSASYGENMKGAILMTSNPNDSITYYTNSITKVPTLGSIYKVDGINKYVSVINYEFYKDFIKYTIEYSQDFNRLSGYTTVQSYVRMWQTSEKQVYDRNVMYNSTITVGSKDTDKQNEDTIVKFQGILGLMNTFSQRVSQNADATLGILKSFRANGETLKIVGLPLNTFAVGNSLVFTCKYADNYSAGRNAVRGEVVNKLIQQDVPYADEYGEVEDLGFAFTTPDTPQADLEVIGDNLPELDLTTIDLKPCVISSSLYGHSPLYDTTVDGALKIKKGSRDTITLTVQLDFTTNDKDIILGYGLTHSNQLVNDRYLDKPAKVYAMTRIIGQFERKVDLTGAILLKTFDKTSYNYDFNMSGTAPNLVSEMSILPIQTTVNAKSMVIVNDDGDLILAVNKTKYALQYYSSIYFNIN